MTNMNYVERLILIIEQFLYANVNGLPMTDDDINQYNNSKDFKNGWNKCELAYITRFMHIEDKHWETTSGEALLVLTLANVGWLDQNNVFNLNMNDTFAYACADCEEVPDNKLNEVVDIFKRHGYDGLTYWVAEQRGYDPGIPEYAKEVKRIRKIEIKRKKKLTKHK